MIERFSTNRRGPVNRTDSLKKGGRRGEDRRREKVRTTKRSERGADL